MSYDLLVFDPEIAPRERSAFLQWFEAQTDWGEGDVQVDTLPEPLRRWHQAMLQAWPDMQEIDDDQTDDPHVTGYSFGAHVIYADFRWSVAEEAYEAVRRLAVECRVGFYDVSGDEGDGEIYFPGDPPRPPSDGRWRQISADFRSGDVGKYVPQDFPQDEPSKRRWFDFFRRDK